MLVGSRFGIVQKILLQPQKSDLEQIVAEFGRKKDGSEHEPDAICRLMQESWSGNRQGQNSVRVKPFQFDLQNPGTAHARR
jgi:hypothetical protein